ncbi:MAG: hypothetical protein QXJ17_04515 [Nitrososphaeria archaeon]
MLFEKGDISVHRRPVKPDHIKLVLQETIHVSERISITKYDDKGNVIREGKGQESTSKPIET